MSSSGQGRGAACCLLEGTVHWQRCAVGCSSSAAQCSAVLAVPPKPKPALSSLGPPASFACSYTPDAAQTTLSPNGTFWLPQGDTGMKMKVQGGHHDAGDWGKYVVNR